MSTEISGNRRKRGRGWPPAVMARISELAILQPPLSAKAIERAIDEEFGAGVGPRERTIGDILLASRAESSEPWSMGNVSPEEAALVMPVWQAVVDKTNGRAHALTAAEAKWLIYIRRVCPEQPRPGEFSFWEMYRLAREFALEEEREEVPAGAQAYLAYAPWRSFDNAWRYADAVRARRIPALLGFPVLLPEVQQEGQRGWTEETIREWHRLHEVLEEGSNDNGPQR